MKHKPKADYSTKSNRRIPLVYNKNEVAWASCLDERYGIEVWKGKSPNAGHYLIFDLNSDKLIHKSKTKIPVVNDFAAIAEWQDRALIFLEEQENSTI